MLKIETVATTWFTCTLTDEEEKKVVDYIKENPDEFEYMDKEDAIAKAVKILYDNDEINLYDNATESDFSTDEIKWSEFEERTAEEILEIDKTKPHHCKLCGAYIEEEHLQVCGKCASEFKF